MTYDYNVQTLVREILNQYTSCTYEEYHKYMSIIQILPQRIQCKVFVTRVQDVRGVDEEQYLNISQHV